MIRQKLADPKQGAAWLLAGLFVAVLFAFLYFGYPFDGMVISDSWFLYATDGGKLTWWTRDQLLSQPLGQDIFAVPRSALTWSALVPRRGLMPIVPILIDRFAFGNRQVFVNLLCILVQLANVGLFMIVLRRLRTGRWFLPIVLCVALYPFASGSHFWQYLIINNLSVTWFLASLVAFLFIDHAAAVLTWRTAVLTLCAMLCFWISVHLVDYAVFMAPLYLYLSLYYSNEESSLIRFPRILSPSFCAGLSVLLMSGWVIAGFAREAPSALVYVPRFQELSAYVPLPAPVVGLLITLGNAALSLASILFSNTIGFLLYPLSTVLRHYKVLLESWWVVGAVGLVAGVGLAVLRLEARGSDADLSSAEQRHKEWFLIFVGGLWALLAYLPFVTAFGYPRVVGLTADRANILGLWGVAFCLGALLYRLGAGLKSQRLRQAALVHAALFILLAVLAGNLHIQKESYIETYQKERQVASVFFDTARQLSKSGRQPVVLLEKAGKMVFPRAQLMTAVAPAEASSKALGLLKFLAKRYFLEEYVTSSFHLDGNMLFGCCPHAALVTADGYARLLNQPRVLVYKNEPPLQVREDDEAYILACQDTALWSRTFGEAQTAIYPKQHYKLVRLELEESVFHLRGALTYHIDSNQAEPER